MRSRNCLQCGVFIQAGKGWKRATSKRIGRFIHDTCLDMYNKHKKISRQIMRNIRTKNWRRSHPIKFKKYQREYYIKNRLRIHNRNYRYYHTHLEQERERSRVRHTVKHYYNEKDNEYLVKVWPKWKTQGGWII